MPVPLLRSLRPSRKNVGDFLDLVRGLLFSGLFFIYLICITLFLLFLAFRCVDTSLAVKIKVTVGDGEPIESALRRFKREVSKSGHLMELRHKRYFENPQQRAIRKVKESRLRKKFERMAKRRQRSQV